MSILVVLLCAVAIESVNPSVAVPAVTLSTSYILRLHNETLLVFPLVSGKKQNYVVLFVGKTL